MTFPMPYISIPRAGWIRLGMIKSTSTWMIGAAEAQDAGEFVAGSFISGVKLPYGNHYLKQIYTERFSLNRLRTTIWLDNNPPEDAWDTLIIGGLTRPRSMFTQTGTSGGWTYWTTPDSSASESDKWIFPFSSTPSSTPPDYLVGLTLKVEFR